MAHLVTGIIRQGNYYDKNNRPTATVVAGCKTKEEAKERGRQKLARKHGYLVSIHDASRIQRDNIPSLDATKMDERWIDTNIVAFDVETTGLDPVDDDIIELGFSARSLSEGFLDPKSFLLGDADEVPEGASEVNGITTEMIDDKPTFAERFDNDIRPYLEKADVLVAHNRGFDAAFLFQAMRQAEVDAPMPPVFCGMELAREIDLTSRQGGPRNDKLGTLVDYYGYTQEDAHRAGEDALMAGRVFFKVALSHKYFQPPCTLQEALRFFDETTWPKDPPEVVV